MDSLEMNPLSQASESSARQEVENPEAAIKDLSGSTNESNCDPVQVNVINESMGVPTGADLQSSANLDDRSNASVKENATSHVSSTGDTAEENKGGSFRRLELIGVINLETGVIEKPDESGPGPIDVATVEKILAMADVISKIEKDESGSEVKKQTEEQMPSQESISTQEESGPIDVTTVEKIIAVADMSKSQKGECGSEVKKQTEEQMPSHESIATPEVSVKNEKAEVISSTHVEKAGIERKLSFKELEESFIAALNVDCTNANEPLKSEIKRKTSTGSMEVSEGSDIKQEVTASQYKDVDEKIDFPTVGRDLGSNYPVMKDKFCKLESIGTNIADNQESNPSSSVPKSEKHESDDNNDEEQKAFFYLSSSDLPPGLNYESSQDLDVLRYRTPANLNELSGSRQRSRSGSSYLCSKSVHGVVFLAAFIVALFGYILYNLAHKGKVPDVFEPVGLTTAIVAGIIGVISFVCFSILGAFPTLPVAGYRRMGDEESLGSRSRIASPQTSIDDESWSSDMERAFRRQNGMTSARTSEVLLTQLSDRQTLIERTEKLKNQVTGFLESFIDVVSQMDPVEDLTEMTTFTEDVDKSISPKISPQGALVLADDE